MRKKKKKDYIGLKRYHWLNKRVEVKGIKRGFLEIRQPGLSGRLTRQTPKGLLWLLIKNITLNPMSPTSLEVVDEESTYRGLFEGRGKPSWPPWCAYLMLYAHSLIPPASLGFISTSTRFLGGRCRSELHCLGPHSQSPRWERREQSPYGSCRSESPGEPDPQAGGLDPGGAYCRSASCQCWVLLARRRPAEGLPVTFPLLQCGGVGAWSWFLADTGLGFLDIAIPKPPP